MTDAQKVPPGTKEVSEFLITYVIKSFGLDLFLHLIRKEFIDVNRSIVVVWYISLLLLFCSLLHTDMGSRHEKLVRFRK